MNNLKLDGEKVSDSVNLLVSMLVRYPEIGTLRFDSSNATLNLTFILTTIPSDEQFRSFKDYLEKSLQSFYYLSAYDNLLLTITMTPYDSITVIHIARDIDTLSKSEIALMIKIIQLHFADNSLQFLYHHPIFSIDLLRLHPCQLHGIFHRVTGIQSISNCSDTIQKLL